MTGTDSPLRLLLVQPLLRALICILMYLLQLQKNFKKPLGQEVTEHNYRVLYYH
jgi:hypothetical protein